MKKLLMLLFVSILLVACSENEYEKELKEAEESLEEAKKESKRIKEVSEKIDETGDLLKEVQEEMGIEPSEDSDKLEVTDESLTRDQAEELLAYEALGEDDLLKEVNITKGEIKAVVEIFDDLFDDKSIIAETIYSRAGDAFLEHQGWEVLTIEFVGIGTVSMNRNEKETNEYGMDYFPLEEIIYQLN